ncbi:outer membrane lipoprotein carrier protein LolA [Acidobacteriota bacterium]
MKVLRRLLLAVAGLALVPFLAAGPAPKAVSIDDLEGGAKLDALIERVVDRQRALRTLEAEFVQLKESSLLLEAVESTGVFLFRAPDLVRWDYRQPDSMVVLFAEDTVTTYHPAQARAEKIKVSNKQRRFVRVLAGTQPLDDLTSHFSITLADPGGRAHYRLTLRPVGNMLSKKLQTVEIEVDRELFLPVVIEYNEADGDSTRYEFKKMVINPEIDDSRFDLELGAGVKLETLDASAGVG